MSVESNFRTHLRGIAGALRFAWIPTLCAVVVALASEDPRGKVYALVLALASLVVGVVFHAREIIHGEPAHRATTGEMPISEEQWTMGLR